MQVQPTYNTQVLRHTLNHQAISRGFDRGVQFTFGGDTTYCFLVHNFKQCPFLMSTLTETDRRVDLLPPQSPPSTLPGHRSVANGTSTLLAASQRCQTLMGLPSQNVLPLTET